MTQNIYDTAEFFEAYSQMARSVHGLDGAPEWPALRALIPPLQGRRVVDLGCGFGWFCRWAQAQGASEILGLDVSQNMLDRARGGTPASAAAGGIVYQRADLEQLQLPPAAYDLAYSSLTLHYIERLAELLPPSIKRWCRAGVSCSRRNTRSTRRPPAPPSCRTPRAGASGR